MKYQPKERVTLTVTGTVITEEECKVNTVVTTGDRDITYLRLDNGVIVKVDTTDDEYGMELEGTYPRYWPPVSGDVWTDDQGCWWYGVEVDFGHRKGIRLKTYTKGTEIIRSGRWFLENNLVPELLVRKEEILRDV
jgi:hypothetical protein